MTLIVHIAVIRSGEPVGYPGFGGGGKMDLADCRCRSESALRFLAFSTLGVNHAELSAEFRAGRDVFLYRDLAGAETGFVGGADRLVA